MFVIWWGTKKVTNPQGFAADFCPICRDVVPVRIYREGIASHVYGIAYGGDETLSHTAQCQVCKSLMPTDFKRYSSIDPLPDTVQVLVRRTSPRIYERCKERLELERIIKETPDQLPQKERYGLIAEKFLAVEPEVSARDEASRFDLDFALALCAYFALAFFAIPRFVTDAVLRGQLETYLLVPSAGLLVYLWVTSRARFMRRKIYPKLSAALRPLKPSESEIKLHLRHLDQRRLKVASLVKPQRLMRWLARPAVVKTASRR